VASAAAAAAADGLRRHKSFGDFERDYRSFD